MRIPSGTADQPIYFLAVDATDGFTPETGLTTWTVYRARNGAAAVAMTTPTIVEVDAVNMPGVYTLLLDENMTIDAGDDSQQMVFHIGHAGMRPVVEKIELYRPKITLGETLVVASGIADADVEKWLGTAVTAGTAGVPNVDVVRVNNGGGAAANLQRAFNGGGVSSLTADSGTTTTLTDTGLNQANTDHWVGQTLVIGSGAMSGMTRRITAFNPATDTITFSPALPSAVTTESYVIIPFSYADDFLDTEIAAIKAKTDNLPADPADASDLAALVDAVPTAAENADALLDRADAVETSWTLRQAMRIILAALAGKASGLDTTSVVFRNVADTKDRITATVDANGNRTDVTLDAS